MPELSRRSLLRMGAAGGLAAFLSACERDGGLPRDLDLEGLIGSPGRPADDGRLTARPLNHPRGGPTGLREMGLRRSRDAFIYVPRSYSPKRPAPLVLIFHGANGWGQGGMKPFLDLVEESGMILVSPASSDRTWDMLLGGFGPDVAFTDRALRNAFRDYAIDEEHLAVAGFSDGASYALSIGVTNGDLFSHVIAWSPGFMAEEERHGKPPIWISHGIDDGVLPIDRTSREIVPRLRKAKYKVRYTEFDGGHAHPPEIERAAMEWFLS